MPIELFPAADARFDEALAIRFRVFVDEQQIPPDLELDEHDRPDSPAVHALARDPAGTAVGAGRLFARDVRTAQIGRMAVLRPARGSGVGRALLTALVDEARRRGFRAATLDAQVTAIGFYAKAGFTADGPTHLDAGIVHQPMQLDLDGSRFGERDRQREAAYIDEHVGDAG